MRDKKKWCRVCEGSGYVQKIGHISFGMEYDSFREHIIEELCPLCDGIGTDSFRFTSYWKYLEIEGE